MRHLQQHGVTLIREGRRHTIVGKDMLKSQIPRHREIVDELARQICKDLGLPFVR
ncbi:addiction module toxin, HicA family [Thiospirillum jenense]|nr:addiction module toxin, HicA family [Thiospirillum jenense]